MVSSCPWWAAWQDGAVGGAQKCRETSELGWTSRSRTALLKVTEEGHGSGSPTSSPNLPRACLGHATGAGTSSVPQFPPLENGTVTTGLLRGAHSTRWERRRPVEGAPGDQLLIRGWSPGPATRGSRPGPRVDPGRVHQEAHSRTAGDSERQERLGPFRMYGRQVRPSGESCHHQTLFFQFCTTSLCSHLAKTLVFKKE